MLAVLVILGALANWQAAETLRHGEIFAKLRAYIEARGGFLADLYACGFCLSHWSGMVVTALIFPFVYAKPLDSLLLPVLWLAVVRLSQLGNDWGYGFCRTPRLNKIENMYLEELAKIGGEGKNGLPKS